MLILCNWAIRFSLLSLYLRQLFSALSCPRRSFALRTYLVGFMAGEVALVRNILRAIRFSPVSYHFFRNLHLSNLTFR